MNKNIQEELSNWQLNNNKSPEKLLKENRITNFKKAIKDNTLDALKL